MILPIRPLYQKFRHGERANFSTGFSDTVLRNFGEVVQKLTLAFGDGIPIESSEIADKGDTIMADGEGSPATCR